MNYKHFLYIYTTALLAIIFIIQGYDITEIFAVNDSVKLDNTGLSNTYSDQVAYSGIYVLSILIYKILKKLYVKYIKPRRMKNNEPTDNQV